jgi:DinB superfamily
MPDETLIVLLDEVRGRTLRYLGGVTDEQARWCPPGLQNTILWHAGHSYFLAEWLGMKALGRHPQVSKGWYRMFSWESQPEVVPADRWPRLDVVVGRLTDQHRRLRQAITQAADDLLMSPADGSHGQTVRFSVVHGLHDEACHTGEILLLRKMQGLGRPSRVSS